MCQLLCQILQARDEKSSGLLRMSVSQETDTEAVMGQHGDGQWGTPRVMGHPRRSRALVPPAARLWGHSVPRSRAASWHVHLRWWEGTVLKQEKGTRPFALWHQLPPGSDHVMSSRVIGNGAKSSHTATTGPTVIRRGRLPCF